jgi:hypothetical protein
MLRVFDCCGSVKEYVAGFLIGHGRRTRWVVSPEGVFEVLIQRMICKACGRTFSLLPRVLRAFYQCANGLVARIRSLWERGLRSMSDVRYILVGACTALEGRLHLSSLYRWARLASP